MTKAYGLAAILAFALSGCGVFQPKKCNNPGDQSDLPDAVVKPLPPSDSIFGQDIPRSDSFYALNGRIYDRGKAIRLKGINWFGFETSTVMLHGLWSGRTMESFIEQTKSLGFNAFRLPISPESLTTQTPAQYGFANSREAMEHFLEATEAAGMYVLMDMHNCSSRNSHLNKPGPAMGACGFYTMDKFLADMREIAELSLKHKNIVGIDLFNEPYGYGWDDWIKLSERAGEVILKTNPRTLVFIEGISDKSPYGRFNPFWGENLYELEQKRPRLPSTRVVYSPHVYGPSVAGQGYFNAPDFPRNMPEIWTEKWGKYAGRLPLVIGEFGGRYVGSDKVWNDAFVDYLVRNDVKDFFYWSLNPNSGDTGGLLLDDWKTVNQDKFRLIKKLMD